MDQVTKVRYPNEDDASTRAAMDLGLTSEFFNADMPATKSVGVQIDAATVLKNSRLISDPYRLLIESVRDYAIYSLDTSGNVTSWNDGAARIKGYTAAEILGKNFSLFYSPGDIAWGKPARALKAALEQGRFEDEGWRIRKNGTRFWASAVITPIIDDAGQHMGFAKVTRDLTERREALERMIADNRRLAAEEAARITAEARAVELAVMASELQERTREAEVANRVKSEFLAKMSHELRTPLTAIGGYAELLSMQIEGPLNKAQLFEVGRILQSQQYLLNVINHLLSFSQLESGHAEVTCSTVSVKTIFDTVGALILPQVRTKEIVFEVGDVADELQVWADSTWAEQILVNLLTNAVKFTPSGGRVSLSCQWEDNHVKCSVTDTGSGIAAEDIENVFEAFAQVKSRSHRSDGVGLGLTISRRLAREMHGDVIATSELGKGSTFTLILPCYASAESDR